MAEGHHATAKARPILRAQLVVADLGIESAGRAVCKGAAFVLGSALALHLPTSVANLYDMDPQPGL